MNIEQVILQTGTCLPEVAAFYEQRLGFITRMPDSDTLYVRAGATELVFNYVPGWVGVYHFAFNVPYDRLDAARVYLEKQNVTLLKNLSGETVFAFDFWDARTIYFYDAAGNIAEFIARRELPACGISDGAFLPDEVEGISEIALPMGDVSEGVAQLCNDLNITTYRETSETFAPIGDAHGLLILVREGREWFPQTGVTAQSLPLVVTVRTTQGERFVVQTEPLRTVPI